MRSVWSSWRLPAGDPREAPKFWERMAAGNKGSTPEWLSTHPSDETRIADLNKAIAEGPEILREVQAVTNKGLRVILSEADRSRDHAERRKACLINPGKAKSPVTLSLSKGDC